jgi:hypothetical protein
MNMKSKTHMTPQLTNMAVDRLIIVCDIHGPMKHVFKYDWWECLGFDGVDDCSVLVRAETLARSEIEVGRHRESDFYPGEDMTVPKPTWHIELKIRIVREDEWLQ